MGNAGVLLTRVEYLKHTPHRDFAIVDAAMNDLMRPALYDAYHEILPVIANGGSDKIYQVVGPVCETGDFLGHDRKLALSQGDLLAICPPGLRHEHELKLQYSSPRRRVMVDGDRNHLIRQRDPWNSCLPRENPP